MACFVQYDIHCKCLQLTHSFHSFLKISICNSFKGKSDIKNSTGISNGSDEKLFFIFIEELELQCFQSYY